MRNPFRTAPPGVTIDNPRLITHSQQPYNAEPPTDQLRACFITQQSGF